MAVPTRSIEEPAARAQEMRAELARKIAAHTTTEGELHTPIHGFSLYRRSEPTPCVSAAYMPRLTVWALRYIFIPLLAHTKIDWFDAAEWGKRTVGATDCGAIFRRLG